MRVKSAKMNASKGKDSGEVIRNYHKQAFEYVSKALRIDEDDTGLFVVFITQFLLCCVWQLVINTPPPCDDRRQGAGCAVVQEGDR